MFERFLEEHVVSIALIRLDLETISILSAIAVTLLDDQLHVVYLLQQVDLVSLQEDTVAELFLLLGLLFRYSPRTTR